MQSVGERQKQGHEVVLNPLPYSSVAATQYFLGPAVGTSYSQAALVLSKGGESHSPAGSSWG